MQNDGRRGGQVGNDEKKHHCSQGRAEGAQRLSQNLKSENEKDPVADCTRRDAGKE
jgi:hypothetical protein